MKLIESKVEYLPQDEGLEGVYKQIELCGRVSYKSEDKITEDSAEPFVKRMIDSHHGAVLEHGTVYLMIHTIAPEEWDKKIGRHKLLTIDDCRDDLRTNPTYDKRGEEYWWAKEAKHKAYVMAVKYADNSHSKVRIVLTKHELNTKGGIILTPTGDIPNIAMETGKVISVFNTILITTNLRVLVENNWLDDLQYLCSPTKYHERRYTFKFTCSRAIANELIRHRAFSFMQESQRFVNYSKEKFGNEITFIKPSWLKEMSYDIEEKYIESLSQAEDNYMWLLHWLQPQQARDVLPNATKTELIMTGFASDWKFLMDLRLFEKTGAVHPDMKDLMQKAQKVAEEAGIWDDIIKYKSKFD